jgi:hypothetical protein
VLRHPLVVVIRKGKKVIHSYRCDTCHCVINERQISQREGEVEFSTSSPTPSLDPMPTFARSPRHPA